MSSSTSREGLPAVPGCELHQRVWSGSRADVFKAVRPPEERPLAVKVARSGAGRGEIEESLTVDRVLSQVHHDSVVRVFDSGKWDLRHYVVMEFVEGDTVAWLIHKSRKLALRKALGIALHVSEALARLSVCYIVHLGVGPDNIMVSEDGHAVLMGFGQARKRDDRGVVEPPSQAAGAPDYRAPERIRGETDLDVRTDFYSLGGTLYHMLVGRPPFPGTTRKEILLGHLHRPLEFPQEAADRIPDDVQEIIEKTMAKEREDRYLTAEVLSADLRGALGRLGPEVSEDDEKEEAALPEQPLAAIPAELSAEPPPGESPAAEPGEVPADEPAAVAAAVAVAVPEPPDQELERVKEQHETTRRHLEEAMRRCGDLMRQRDDALAAKEGVAGRTDELEDTVDRLQQDLAARIESERVATRELEEAKVTIARELAERAEGHERTADEMEIRFANERAEIEESRVELQGTLEELRNELDTKRDAERYATQELEEARVAIALELAAREEERQALEAGLAEERDAAAARVAEAENRFTEERATFEEQRAELISRLESTVARVTTAEAQAATAAKTAEGLESHRAEAARLAVERDEARSEAEELRRTLKTLEEAERRRDREREEELAARTGEHETAVADLQEQFAKEREALEEGRRNLETRIEELTRDLRAREQEEKLTTQELEERKVAIARDISAQKERQEKAAAAMEERFAKERSELEESRKALEARVAELQKDLESRREADDLATQEFEQAKIAIAEERAAGEEKQQAAADEIELRFERERGALEEQQARLVAELETLRARLVEAEAEAKQASEAAASVEVREAENAARLARERDAARAEAAAAEARTASLTRETQELRKTVESLEESGRRREAEPLPPASAETPATSKDDDSSLDRLVLVPGGAFVSGAEEGDHVDSPPREIEVGGFWVDVFPVTNAQYREFVTATGRPPVQHWENGRIPNGLEHHPVVWVTWQDAVDYADWKGMRLPTLKEWQKAARGTDGRTFPWGAEPEVARCNCKEAGTGGTTPVRQYNAGRSPHGLADIAGNVAEWVSGEIEGPDGRSKRVACGGSFKDGIDLCGCAVRRPFPYWWKSAHIGFRCAASK